MNRTEEEGKSTLDKAVVLWIDLREDRSAPIVYSELLSCSRFCLLEHPEQLTEKISKIQPDVICFEFDYPDARHLQELEQTKLGFPSTPILMLTEQRSEELAIWALRARVWDYLVKPLNKDDLCCRVHLLRGLGLRRKFDKAKSRHLVLPEQSSIEHIDHLKKTANNKTSLRAIAYVESHYQEKIQVSALAERCRLSPYQFSRVFKREQSLTFRDFLVRYRIEKACELLKDAGNPVGDVAFSVGFSDHSHFTRIFRRYVGQSPTEYRQRYTRAAR